jgi:serine protease Do
MLTCSAWRTSGIALVLSLAASLGTAHAADAENPPSSAGYHTLGFSNLVFRLEGDDVVGVAKDSMRVHIIEALRADGFEAVGAEDLVFGRDEAGRAEMMLGGTILNGKCHSDEWLANCRIEIEWQLRSESEGRVVYRALTRFNLMGVPSDEISPTGKRLVLGALHRLTDRRDFRDVLRRAASASTRVAPATLRACTSGAHTMPSSAEAVIDATLLVRSGSDVGSGFMVSPDGYVLTAAHVVQRGAVRVRTRSGQIFRASVVRADADVALLRLREASRQAEPGVPERATAHFEAETPCLSIGALPETGAEVYAIGAPAGADLAFSLTRGIISGLRRVHGAQLLQTDASVSPGNSGGPLVDTDGRAVALVQAKLAGTGIEGVAFGTPVIDALAALNLTLGDQTDLALRRETRAAKREAAPEVIIAPPDVRRSVDPDGDRRRLRDELTPGYIGVMKWGGLTLASVGLLTVLVSAANHSNGEDDYAQWERTRTTNDLGWLGVGLGLGSYVGALMLRPSVREEDLYRHRFDVSWAVGVGSAALRVRY